MMFHVPFRLRVSSTNTNQHDLTQMGNGNGSPRVLQAVSPANPVAPWPAPSMAPPWPSHFGKGRSWYFYMLSYLNPQLLGGTCLTSRVNQFIHHVSLTAKYQVRSLCSILNHTHTFRDLWLSLTHINPALTALCYRCNLFLVVLAVSQHMPKRRENTMAYNGKYFQHWINKILNKLRSANF